jgi:hypothetical protein
MIVVIIEGLIVILQGLYEEVLHPLVIDTPMVLQLDVLVDANTLVLGLLSLSIQ